MVTQTRIEPPAEYLGPVLWPKERQERKRPIYTCVCSTCGREHNPPPAAAYNTCPTCGQRKSAVAKTCADCYFFRQASPKLGKLAHTLELAYGLIEDGAIRPLPKAEIAKRFKVSLSLVHKYINEGLWMLGLDKRSPIYTRDSLTAIGDVRQALVSAWWRTRRPLNGHTDPD